MSNLNREFIRLAILQILQAEVAYTANQEILRVALDRDGYRMSRDALHVELAWLSDMDLIVDQVVQGVHIATLTADGIDVAEGVRVIPGVRRPGPK